MGKKDVGGSHFHVGASTARRSRKKDGYRRAFGLYRFARLFIACFLVSVCEVVGLQPVPNGDQSHGNPGSGLRKLVFDYLAGSGTAYNNVVSTYGHIQNWDTSRVTDMKYLFYKMNLGYLDISKWNTGAVINMNNSKSFTIECCVFCLCQVMLFVCWLVGCC
jgi:surface protein